MDSIFNQNEYLANTQTPPDAHQQWNQQMAGNNFQQGQQFGQQAAVANSQGFHQPPQPQQPQQPQQQDPGQLYQGLVSIKQQEDLPHKAPIILIYGPAGIGCTTLAISTSPNAILFDYDRTADHSPDQAKHTVVLDPLKQGWPEVARAENGLFAQIRQGCDTVIINGVNELLEWWIMPALQKKYPHLQNEENIGELFGKIGDEFRRHMDHLQGLGFCIILVAHACEAKTMAGHDYARYQPCIIGSKVGKVIQVLADQIGYYYFDEAGDRTIDFNPTQCWEGKNSAGIGAMKIGAQGQARHWMQDKVIKAIRQIHRPSEGSPKAQTVNQWEHSIMQAAGNPADLQKLHSQAVQHLSGELLFLLEGSFSEAAKQLAQPASQIAPQTAPPAPPAAQMDLLTQPAPQTPPAAPITDKDSGFIQDFIQAADTVFNVAKTMNWTSPVNMVTLGTWLLMPALAPYGLTAELKAKHTDQEWQQKILPIVNAKIKEDVNGISDDDDLPF